MDRLVVVGMCNPQGSRPLWTEPPGCAGHRLWQMASARTRITQEQWLGMTDRRNLCAGKVWSRSEAQETARRWRDELLGRTVVMLGMDVILAMRDERTMRLWEPFEWWTDRDWVEIPHSSGLCREYNNPVTRAAAEILLADLVEHFLPAPVVPEFLGRAA